MKNGFETAVDNLKTVAKVDQNVSIEALTEAAEYFANQLKRNFNRSTLNKEHAADQIKVVVKKDVVQVVFGEKGWYWYLVENGHKKVGSRGRVKGSHVVRTTVEKESKKLQEMILAKL